MDIQSDIKWIKSELNHVKDPRLIEVFKQLLRYNKENTVETAAFFKTVKDEKRKRAEASMLSVKQGKTRKLEDFKNEEG